MTVRDLLQGADPNIIALIHTLDVEHAELEVQKLELAAANDELRRNNEALTSARDRYRVLYDRAPSALVTVDVRGTILEANRAAEVLLQTPRAHLIDRRLPLFVVEAERSAMHALLGGLFAGGRVDDVETRIAPDGDAAIDVRIDGCLIDDSGGRAILALVDVSARTRTEEARRALARGVDDARRRESLRVLAAGVAHDFNNLLTVVVGGTDQALTEVGPESPVSNLLGEALRAARRAGELAHQMLAYSGHVSAPPRPTNVGALIRRVGPRIRASLETTPVEMALSESLWVNGDEVLLGQVVLAAATNAAEAMQGRSGAITIAVRSETPTADAIARMQPGGDLAAGPCVVLEVRDVGVGMDAATKARMFEPYFSTKFAGRGLGLAVVQGIVRAHGGAISVASEVGRGTTFRVYLPAAQPALSATHATAPTERRTGGTVLLVDDEEPIRRIVTRVVQSMGFIVLTAADGVEAVEVFRAERAHVDLVLMDLTMPRMDGVAAGKAIRALDSEVPIVLITGFGELPAESAGLFAGTLTKPFDLEAMGQMLHVSRVSAERDAPAPAVRRVLVVHSNGAVRAAVRSCISDLGFEVVAVSSAASALELAASHHIDFAAVEHDPPWAHADQIVRALRDRHPELPVIVTAASPQVEDPALDRSFRLDAPFSLEQLEDAVRATFVQAR